MSRRKPSRNPRRAERSKPPEPQPYRTSAAAIVLTVVVATLTSTILYVQLDDPGSMLGAIRRVEYISMIPAESGTARLMGATNATWDDVGAARDAALGAHPDSAAHFALRQLIGRLVDVHQGRQGARQAAVLSRNELAADPDNLLARLVHATIVDSHPAAGADEGPSAADRFETMRRIVEAEAPARRATLYNAEFTRSWHTVLRRYFRRPDVAVSLAASMPSYQIVDHYAALPVIRDRIVSLAVGLRAEGRPEEAETCIRWLGEAALGLIDADPDAGTRLLCAEVLAGLADTWAGKTDGESSDVLKGLERFRRDYHARVEAAPVDLCDQSFTARAAIDSVAYNAAFHRLVFAGVALLAAIGAAALFVLAGLGALVQAARARGGRPSAEERHCSFLSKFALVLLPTIAVALLAVANFVQYGFRSQAWVVTAAIGAGLAGVLVALAVAGVVTVPREKQGRRLALSAGLACAVILFAAVPSPVVSRVCWNLGLASGGPWITVVGLVVLVLIGLWLSPSSLRTIAATAALAWCLNVTAAFVTYQLHRRADRHYQETVVSGRLDEITARLGAGWQETYLGPARRAFGGERP